MEIDITWIVLLKLIITGIGDGKDFIHSCKSGFLLVCLALGFLPSFRFSEHLNQASLMLSIKIDILKMKEQSYEKE